MKLLFTLTIGILASIPVFAQDNPELQRMADNDQKQRMGQNIDWKELNKQDSIRRVKTLSFMKAGKIKTAKDYYNVGIIFNMETTLLQAVSL